MAKATLCCGLLLFKSRTLPDAESLLATENRQLVVYNRQESKVSWNHQVPAVKSLSLDKGHTAGLDCCLGEEGVQQKQEILLPGKRKQEKNWKEGCKEVSAAHPGNQLVKNVFSMSEPERSSTPHRFLNRNTKIQSHYKMSDKFSLSQFNSFTKESHLST